MQHSKRQEAQSRSGLQPHPRGDDTLLFSCGCVQSCPRLRQGSTPCFRVSATQLLFVPSGCSGVHTNSSRGRPHGPHPGRNARAHFGLALTLALRARPSAPGSLSLLHPCQCPVAATEGCARSPASSPTARANAAASLYALQLRKGRRSNTGAHSIVGLLLPDRYSRSRSDTFSQDE